ncbi:MULTISPECIES: hypothetical protein [Pseudomonas]|uniref:Uncharacterized protein n=1 Tax=Pseudomonas mosselii TaxID=78327 RepID=A0A5R8Z698_9PSED|nr:hypothetical protein [Pseudomonas mosselii]TLP61322.1 hypothetical protein FEM01_12105 [Pseudomonas mosselii]
MQALEFLDLSSLAGERWDAAFHGTQCDERDEKVKELLVSAADNVFSFEYDRENMNVVIGEGRVELHELEGFASTWRGKRILVDATSFDVAEFAILSFAFKSVVDLVLDVLYAEPEEYKKSEDAGGHVFELSESMLGFEEAGIPGISKAIPVDEPKLFVFFMGYEGDRFKNALEFSEFTRAECNLVFGVPAFKFGWEKNSLLTSARAILENNLQDSFLYCGATNIGGIYNLLEGLRKKYQDEVFFLVPLGPKPMSVGAIKFLCSDKNSSLLYDHPARSSNRSYGISRVHLVRGFFS